MECHKGDTIKPHDTAATEEVGVADTERQDLRRISLEELRQSAQKGKFLEIQWTATIALAILYIDSLP
jgi:hypothetical protein